MGLIISAGFAMQLLTHYYSWPTPFALSERVFDAEAYLLTQGINQHNGANLLPSLHEDVDRIAEPDPLFRSQGFAYYHNKQSGQEPFTTFRAPGELLLDPTHGDFVKRCTSLVATNSTHYNTEAKSYELSLALTLPVFQRLAAMLHRDTYYLLDEQGAVHAAVQRRPGWLLPGVGTLLTLTHH